MKIGITVDIGKSSIWANGITQNGIYLAILFKKLGYECDILTENKLNASIALIIFFSFQQFGIIMDIADNF